MRPFFVPRTTSTRPRIDTFTSAGSTPGSSTRRRITSPSSTTSTFGSQDDAGGVPRLFVSTNAAKRRLSSPWSRESSTIGP